MKTLLTIKQRQVLRVILDGDGHDEEGKFIAVDMDRLLELIPYKTTKQSMQFTIRTLIRNGLLHKGRFENRRGRQRITFVGTDLAYQILKGEKAGPQQSDSESSPKNNLSEDELDLVLDLESDETISSLMN